MALCLAPVRRGGTCRPVRITRHGPGAADGTDGEGRGWRGAAVGRIHPGPAAQAVHLTLHLRAEGSLCLLLQHEGAKPRLWREVEPRSVPEGPALPRASRSFIVASTEGWEENWPTAQIYGRPFCLHGGLSLSGRLLCPHAAPAFNEEDPSKIRASVLNLFVTLMKVFVAS